jgi:hypothetical protein
MSVIAIRAWREPAVFIGLLASVALAIIALATGDHWDTATIAGVAAPLLSALGIRQFVTPTPDVVAAEVKSTPPPGAKG